MVMHFIYQTGNYSVHRSELDSFQVGEVTKVFLGFDKETVYLVLSNLVTTEI